MTREEKAVIIQELTEKFQEKPFFYIMDASGMTVAQVNAFRRMCFEKGIEYRVVKNTLIRKALERIEGDFTPFNDTVLTGFSGVLFSNESGKAPAALIKEFRKKSGKDKPVFKGASVDASLFIGESSLETLYTLKSKNELIGEIVGLLQSPAKNVVSALQSGGNKLAGIVKTLQEREG
ncbi:50S ribosomal protein L10 [Cytophagaceae bacterium YF14B1]|uniref:Large ribosomal subunit protein uL10 n=1 Tax=Xanthocytophaga flava TaxID=3048013 RepID=A0AAE3QK77_9BACT|nr:50S ribosomal protein L10 [Xanthocytophaga flavus]MDJ1480126.1 50S ribosomal protein L10 [Xanthocytophaga flavus]